MNGFAIEFRNWVLKGMILAEEKVKEKLKHAMDIWVREFRPYSDHKSLWTGDYGRIRPAVVRTFIKEAGKAAGTPELHPHSLRHYCGTKLMESGMDIRKIQVHLGHSSIASTQLYTHMRSQTLQAEIYELYRSVREPDFFEYEEGVVI